MTQATLEELTEIFQTRYDEMCEDLELAIDLTKPTHPEDELFRDELLLTLEESIDSMSNVLELLAQQRIK